MRIALLPAAMMFGTPALAAPTCVNTSADGQNFAVCQEAGVDRTWFEAKDYCYQTYGTSLATIRTAAQQTAIVSTRNTTLGLVDLPFGLHDLNIEGTYRWNSGVGPLTGFTYWGSDAPNNAGNEDCGVLSSVADGAWNDVDCQVGRESFVCDVAIPLSDRVDDMVSDANGLYAVRFGGDAPLHEGAPARLRPSRLEQQMQQALDALEAGGCTVHPMIEEHAAGIYSPSFSAGEDSNGAPLINPGYQVSPGHVFGWTQGSVLVGEAGGFASDWGSRKLVAERDETNGFAVGRYARVAGRRGVFLAITGTCRQGVDPFAILEADWF